MNTGSIRRIQHTGTRLGSRWAEDELLTALSGAMKPRTHRARLRDRPTKDGADVRLVIINNGQADGVQAAQRRIKDLAPVGRNKSVAKSDWGCQILRWYRGPRSAGNHAA